MSLLLFLAVLWVHLHKAGEDSQVLQLLHDGHKAGCVSQHGAEELGHVAIILSHTRSSQFTESGSACDPNFFSFFFCFEHVPVKKWDNDLISILLVTYKYELLSGPLNTSKFTTI